MNPRDRRHRLNEIRSVAKELRSTAPAPCEVPDFTDAILGRVDAERPFLNTSARRCVWVGRAAIGASVAIVAMCGFLTYRYAPRALEVSPQERPLTAMVESAEARAALHVASVRESLVETPRALSALVPDIEAAIDGPGQGRCQKFCGPMLPPAVAARREERVGGSVSSLGSASGGQMLRVMATPGGPMVVGRWDWEDGRAAASVNASTGSAVRDVRPMLRLTPATLRAARVLEASPGLVPLEESEPGMTPR